MRCCVAEEAGAQAAHTVSAVAAISSPIDLAAGGRAIGQGFNRQVYTRMFLRSMKPKALRQAGAASRALRPQQAAGGAHAARFRQRLHGPVARLSRCRRLLETGLGQAAARADPDPGAGAQCPQRSVRAGVVAAAAGGGRTPRDPVAAAARRSRRLSRRALAGPRAHPPRAGHGMVGYPALTRARNQAPCGAWTRSSGKRSRSAQRAALLRLARARRARRLVHARRAHPARRAVPEGQGQPDPAREAARVHRAQLPA